MHKVRAAFVAPKECITMQKLQILVSTPRLFFCKEQTVTKKNQRETFIFCIFIPFFFFNINKILAFQKTVMVGGGGKARDHETVEKKPAPDVVFGS